MHDSISQQIVGLAVANRATTPPAPYAAPSLVRDLVHEALCAGLQTSRPAPLAGFIAPGECVLLKPNWVLDVNRGGHGMDCLVTNVAFLEAVLREVREAQPGRVVIGDAPVQGCDWDRLVTPELKRRLTKALDGIPLTFVDFRRQVLRGDLAAGVDRGVNADDRYALFDLGADSLLEPVSRPEGSFRVTMYDPRRLAETHRPGRHRYLVSREPLEADVMLNLPKLKTHRKSGITAALKNLVGINGNKDYLPHHRAGGSEVGGDCYPDAPFLKGLAEALLDRANRNIGRREFRTWKSLSSLALNAHAALGLASDVLAGPYPPRRADLRSRRLSRSDLEGGWFGNDTVWRMCLDLNRILLYGTPEGAMTDRPHRRVLHLCDAIVAGQGEGPLNSEPLAAGLVTCSTSAAAADLVHCGLLGMDWMRIPLVREAFGSFRWPLAGSPDTVSARIGGQALSPDEVADRFGLNAVLPRGWVGHCERGGAERMTG